MKKFLVSLLLGIALLFNTNFAGITSAETIKTIDSAQISNGIVNVAYNITADKKLKVLVEKSGKRISYNLKNDGTIESFPLQYGNGSYKVSIMENVQGNTYKYVATENINLSLADQNEVYLASVQNINWNEDMKAVKMADELTRDAKSDLEKLELIYNYIVANFRYDFDKLKNLKNDYVPNIDNTLETHKGICYDYASLFASMLRSEGIPAKLVKGYSKNTEGYHAWNEVYDESTNKWIIIDTTYDAQMNAVKAKYSMEKKESEYTKVNEY